MAISISASSYLRSIRSVRHRLGEIIANDAGAIALHDHADTIEWAYNILDQIVREIEHGAPQEFYRP